MSSEENWKGGEGEQRGGQILSPKREQSVFKAEGKAPVLALGIRRAGVLYLALQDLDSDPPLHTETFQGQNQRQLSLPGPTPGSRRFHLLSSSLTTNKLDPISLL